MLLEHKKYCWLWNLTFIGFWP